MKPFQTVEGTTPLLISMPHNASEIPESVKKRMTSVGQRSIDSDWFVDKLYDFTEELGAHIIKPQFSRYYIDLNRNTTGENLYSGASSTELCPTTSFSGEALYLQNQEPTESEIQQRIESAWQPYHQQLKSTLEAIKEQHGFAILLDAHSIQSEVPRFFNGILPDFNFGTNSGASCSKALLDAVQQINFEPYSRVTDGRFKGGYITRNYGHPKNRIEAIQLELSQRTYMDEDTLNWNNSKVEEVREQLKRLVSCLINYPCQIQA